MLECAHFVHLCNRGQWPSWLKAQLPPFRPSKQGGIQGVHPLFGGRGGMADGLVGQSTSPITVQSVQQRRAIAMQLQASKTFHQWAEVSTFSELLIGYYVTEQLIYLYKLYPVTSTFAFLACV